MLDVNLAHGLVVDMAQMRFYFLHAPHTNGVHLFGFHLLFYHLFYYTLVATLFPDIVYLSALFAGLLEPFAPCSVLLVFDSKHWFVAVLTFYVLHQTCLFVFLGGRKVVLLSAEVALSHYCLTNLLFVQKDLRAFLLMFRQYLVFEFHPAQLT